MKTLLNTAAELSRIVGGIITDIDPLEDGCNENLQESIIIDVMEVEDSIERDAKEVK